jgi:hypothetical protein
VLRLRRSRSVSPVRAAVSTPIGVCSTTSIEGCCPLPSATGLVLAVVAAGIDPPRSAAIAASGLGSRVSGLGSRVSGLGSTLAAPGPPDLAEARRRHRRTGKQEGPGRVRPGPSCSFPKVTLAYALAALPRTTHPVGSGLDDHPRPLRLAAQADDDRRAGLVRTLATEPGPGEPPASECWMRCCC